MAGQQAEKNRLLRTTAACCLVGFGCMLLPSELQSAARCHVADLLAPGQRVAHQGRSLLASTKVAPDSPSFRSADTDRIHAQVEQLQLELRQQHLREAKLQQRLADRKQHGASPFIASKSPPLVRHELIEARVLGREKDLDAQSALLLDLGSSDGAVSEAFVVRGTSPVLDVGANASVAAGQPVYTGRCVIGRIERTGRWTSAVQLITDPTYTGRAQLLRRTEGGVVPGAEGILAGLGDGTCRLSGIPYTEPVAIGDDVYTGGRSARFPDPMYYGRIVKAELQAGQRWELIVRPHADFDAIERVAVLRQTLGTVRVLGQ